VIIDYIDIAIQFLHYGSTIIILWAIFNLYAKISRTW